MCEACRFDDRRNIWRLVPTDGFVSVKVVFK